ncbi:PREDICTED: complex I intermediate-associated protein 30, mitochondrial [Bactrocera latifrons]|uniref:Putative complex I intermediate-associated protein 30, mitochondrial n=1 Tax=Bactrocera latifrons TaxID=174628 RepID=A0A0K8TYF3_BACLA|nr:PREDICTED: complex I intermediate-associated protein 30, mitochondrial [Bactrocera latifrons]
MNVLRSYIIRGTSGVLQIPEIIVPSFIHTSAIRKTFWEKEKKSGYTSNVTLPSRKDLIVEGFRELKKEIQLWKDEMKEKIDSDPILVYRPGETDVVFNFKNESAFDTWIVTTDADHREGKSTAKLEMSSGGAGLFHGNVNSEHVKDGIVKRTGYANIRTKRVRRSFKRESTYDWTQYNTLVMKIRGDGRSYLINLHTEGYFDIQWNDVYHYVLFTRGGPHWQLVKIPFSKFFLSSKGRIQDRQGPIRLDRVTHFGFSVGAKNNMDGPFQLEIEYVGLEFDPNHREEFAYEMYKTDKYIVAT